MREEIAALQEATELEKHKNQNLIRILKEKANAKRGLTPKKGHSGYVILNAEEFTYIHKYAGYSASDVMSIPCWRVRLQTPYVVAMDFKSISSLVYGDLLHVIGALMNIVGIFNINENNGSEVKELLEKPGNWIFKASYRANAVKGFWEAEYLTKHCITVSQEML